MSMQHVVWECIYHYPPDCMGIHYDKIYVAALNMNSVMEKVYAYEKEQRRGGTITFTSIKKLGLLI